MRKIFFIQPAIPKYRVPFFEGLSYFFDIEIYTSAVDFLGVHTVYDKKNMKLLPGFVSLLGGRFFWMKKLPLFLNFSKNDIVIINGNPRVINYMILFFVLKMKGVRVIWWGHGWSAGSHGLSANIRILLMKLLSPYFLFYTDREKELLNLNNSYALNNGLDSVKYKQEIINSGCYRTPPKENGKVSLLYIGRLTNKSNIPLLLRAISLCDDKVHLNIIGGGAQQKEYTKLANELNISSRITWHGPIFNDEDITKIMISCHAFVYAGAVGLSLIHAFNYGLPAIIHSSAEHHMPEFAAFKNGYNGLSFEFDNITSLANAINKFSSLSEKEYFELERNAYETVRESYNVEDMILRFRKMIEEISCQ